MQDEQDPSVIKQLVVECEAMAGYAMATGYRIPSSALGNIQVASLLLSSLEDAAEPTLRTHIRRLVQAHDQLVHLIAPATPRTLVLFGRERASALGPVRLVRQMMVMSGVLLVVFLSTALSPRVTTASGDIFNSSGLTLAVNELFLLSAAGIGAAFAALFKPTGTSRRSPTMRNTNPPIGSGSYWVCLQGLFSHRWYQ